MRQCCKVMVNNSLIQPRGLSARHCRPSPRERIFQEEKICIRPRHSRGCPSFLTGG
jgi:hypothetical protein